MFPLFLICFGLKDSKQNPVAGKCHGFVKLLHPATVLRIADVIQNIPICVRLVPFIIPALAPRSSPSPTAKSSGKTKGDGWDHFSIFLFNVLTVRQVDEIWWHFCPGLLFPRRTEVSTYNQVLWNQRKEDVSLFPFWLNPQRKREKASLSFRKIAQMFSLVWFFWNHL